MMANPALGTYWAITSYRGYYLSMTATINGKLVSVGFQEGQLIFARPIRGLSRGFTQLTSIIFSETGERYELSDDGYYQTPIKTGEASCVDVKP